jgi:hypothetical protein
MTVSTKKKESNRLAVPLLAAGAVFLAGATASVSSAEPERENPETGGRNPGARAQTVPSLSGALARVAEDPEFAKALLRAPEQFQSAYNLSDSQIEVLKNSSAAIGDVAALGDDCNYCAS